MKWSVLLQLKHSLQYAGQLFQGCTSGAFSMHSECVLMNE